MPLTDLTPANTTQPQGPLPAGNGPALPPLDWQRPVFTAPGPRAAPPHATAGRIPGVVRSSRPRWTPEKHARILARIQASRTDVMPPLPESAEEAWGETPPGAALSDLTGAITRIAEQTTSCFYRLTEGALDLLQRAMPAGSGGSWPLPGAGAAQAADTGHAQQSPAESTDPTCAVKPAGAFNLATVSAIVRQDFDITVSSALASRSDGSLNGVVIVIGDAEHFHPGMMQLIDDVLSKAFGRNDLMFAEAPAGQPVSGYPCHGVPPQQCIGIDDPAARARLHTLETAYFSASRAAIELVRAELPAAQRDALVPPLGREPTVVDVSQRLTEIGRLIGSGRIHIPPKRVPEIAGQIQASNRNFEALSKLVSDPANCQARDAHMVQALRSAVESGRLQDRKGFAVIGQAHLSNIKSTLLKALPCIVLEQKKFKDLPPLTWNTGLRVTY